MTRRDTESLAAELEGHPDFRVLRRLDVTREWPALAGSDVSHAVLLRVPRYGTERDASLAAADQGMDVVLREWRSARLSILQTYPRPRKAGEGWRCVVQYRPPVGQALEMMNEQIRKENQAAKKDL